MKPIDINIDIDLSEFDIVKSSFKSRYIKPKIADNKKESMMKYSKAEKLVGSFDVEPGFRHYAIVAGDFIFGDFIEAIIVKNNWYCEEMFISTLSMSENNVDSLENLFNGNYLGRLALVLSAYFYSHERQKNRMIEYIFNSLDKNDKLDVAITRTHCKICQFKTNEGHHIVIHGSANLRSNQNLEQLTIEDNKELYEFNKEYHRELIEKHGIINKKVKVV